MQPASFGSPLAHPGPVGTSVFWFAALVLALCALRQYLAGAWLQLDNDLGWHLGYGHMVLQSLSLPGPDTWTWTASGQPYQLTQLGGEVLLAAAERLGGPTGLGLLMSACLAVTLSLSFAACRIAGASPMRAAAVCLVVLLPLFAGTVRPAVFGWLLLAWLTFHSTRLLADGNRWDAAACAAICTLWTSVHGSFPVGLVVLACVLAHAALHKLSGQVSPGDSPAQESVAAVGTQASLGWLTGCGAAAVLGSLLANPYGADAWRAVWVVAQLETTRQAHFADWQPVHLLSGLGLPSLWALAALVILARRPGSSWPLLAACAAVAAIGLTAQRAVALSAILAAPLLARALSRSEEQASTSAAIAQGDDKSLGGGLLDRAWAGAAASALAAAALVSVNITPQSIARAEEAIYPSRVAPALVAATPGRKLFCEAEQGGWWIRRYPQMLVSLDGRADLHPDAAYFLHDRIIQAKPGWQQDLERLDPDAASLRKASPLAAELARFAGWRKVAEDENYVAFVRTTTR